jgi:uncharacterized protein involved in outer membrane biogenesis
MKIKYLLFGLLGLIVAVFVGGYIYLSTLDFETLKAQVAREVERATGRQLTIGGPIDLAIGLQPAVTVGQAALSNAEWGSRPQMITLERFELEVELLPLLSGDVRVNRIVLVEPDILLETSESGEGNWAMTGAAGDGALAAPAEGGEQGEPLIPEIVTLDIEGGTLVYRDGVTGQSMTLELASLTLAQEGDGQSLDMDASFQGVPIALSGTLGSVQTAMADADFPLDLSGSVAGNEVSAKGTVATPLSGPSPDLTIAASGDSLASFSPLAAGAEIPPLGPFSLEGRTRVSGRTYGLDGLKLTLGESDLSGKLAADLSGERPKVTADLTAAVLDLQDFQSEAGDAEAAGEGDADSGATGGDGTASVGDGRYVIPDTPLPLGALKSADATIRLKAGVLRIDPELELSDITVGVDLAGGNLQITPLQAGYQQSRLEGRIGLDASRETPQLATQFAVDELDFGRILNEQGLTDEVEGTMDIRIDLTGAGGSPRAIASSLNGSTELLNEGGTISNKLLAIIGADVGSVLGPLLGESDTTALNCIVSRFQVENGLATSRAMVLDTATFSLAGTGTVDLRSEELDLTFDTSSRVPALVSLAIPFKVQGTMKNPQVIPDPVGALKGIAGAAATVSNPLAVLGGLAGAAGVDAAGEEDGEQANPCLTALDPDAQAATGDEQAAPQPVDDAGEAVQDLVPEGAAEDAGKAIEEGVDQLRGLFGD